MRKDELKTLKLTRQHFFEHRWHYRAPKKLGGVMAASEQTDMVISVNELADGKAI